MTAYVIFIQEQTTNLEELKTYEQAAPATMEGHAGTMLVLAGRQEVLEGPEVESATIIAFPSLDEAKAWYDSPAYRAVREHRFKGAKYRVMIVEGLS